MPKFLRLLFTTVAIAGLTACGGSDNAGVTTSTTTTATNTTPTVSITPSTTTPTTSLTYAFPLSGITFNLAPGDSVNVPPGTTVQSANGSATLNGNYGILYTGAGARVTVPPNPTGAAIATNLVSTAVPASGAAYLGPALISPLVGSATAVSPVSDGSGSAAILAGDGRLAADIYGNIFSSDTGALKAVQASGSVSTVVGTNNPYNWRALAPDAAGNVYGQGLSVTSPAGRSALSIHVRKPNGSLTTVAENWVSTATPSTNWSSTGIAVGSTGVLYAIDSIGHRVVRFFFSGVPQVMAGSGNPGFTDGTGTAASFNNPSDLAVDSKGNVYVADTGNHAVRKISNTGTVVTIALTGNPGPITVDSTGNVYCLASAPATLVRISADLGVITSTALPGVNGTATGLAVVPDGTVYVAARTDTNGAHIYRVAK